MPRTARKRLVDPRDGITSAMVPPVIQPPPDEVEEKAPRKGGKPRSRGQAERKQRRLQQAKKQADQSAPYGKQAHEFAERALMKRQKKQMHKQDFKR